MTVLWLSSKLLNPEHARKYFGANLKPVNFHNLILLGFVLIFQYFTEYEDIMVWCNSMLIISDKIHEVKLTQRAVKKLLNPLYVLRNTMIRNTCGTSAKT